MIRSILDYLEQSQNQAKSKTSQITHKDESVTRTPNCENRQYLNLHQLRSMSRSAVLFGVLLVLEMAAFLGESDEVGEDHSAEADMQERINGAGLDVLGMVVIQAFVDGFLDVIDCEHGLDVCREFLQLQAFDLVVEVPHRHYSFADKIGDSAKP